MQGSKHLGYFPKQMAFGRAHPNAPFYVKFIQLPQQQAIMDSDGQPLASCDVKELVEMKLSFLFRNQEAPLHEVDG